MHNAYLFREIKNIKRRSLAHDRQRRGSVDMLGTIHPPLISHKVEALMQEDLPPIALQRRMIFENSKCQSESVGIQQLSWSLCFGLELVLY